MNQERAEMVGLTSVVNHGLFCGNAPARAAEPPRQRLQLVTLIEAVEQQVSVVLVSWQRAGNASFTRLKILSVE